MTASAAAERIVLLHNLALDLNNKDRDEAMMDLLDAAAYIAAQRGDSVNDWREQCAITLEEAKEGVARARAKKQLAEIFKPEKKS